MCVQHAIGYVDITKYRKHGEITYDYITNITRDYNNDDLVTSVILAFKAGKESMKAAIGPLFSDETLVRMYVDQIEYSDDAWSGANIHVNFIYMINRTMAITKDYYITWFADSGVVML